MPFGFEDLRHEFSGQQADRPDCGYWPSRPDLPFRQAPMRSLGYRACCFAACRGSLTSLGPTVARDLTPSAGVAFPLQPQSRRPVLGFRSSIPSPPLPLSTLQPSPYDERCKTRGRNGVASPYPVGFFHPLQHAGLSPRSAVPLTPIHPKLASSLLSSSTCPTRKFHKFEHFERLAIGGQSCLGSMS